MSEGRIKVIKSLNEQRIKAGITWDYIANKTHKSVETVKRQMAETANPQLDTLVELAQALGGNIYFLTAEQAIDLDGKEMELALEQVKLLQEQNTQLVNMLQSKDELLNERYLRIVEQDKEVERVRADNDKKVAYLRAQIEEQAQLLRKKEGAIERKDELLSQFVARFMGLGESK